MSNVQNVAIVAIICLQTLFGSFSSTINQYIYAFYLQTYPNTSTNIENVTLTTSRYRSLYWLNVAENVTDAQLWAQQRSAELVFWIHLMSSGPVIIMTYVLGLYTSKLGKRFVLIFTMFGMGMEIVIWLAIIYFHLSEYWWFVAAVIVGLSGSSGVLGLTLTIMITENTVESQRSSQFVRLSAMQTAISAMATFAVGYYIEWRGFLNLYWASLSFQILSIVIVIVCFKSVDTHSDERTPLLSPLNDQTQELSPTNCDQFFQICTVLRSNQRAKQKTISIWLTLSANMFYLFATTAFSPFLWFLLNTPFCWTSKDIGNYSALSAISYAVLSLLGMKMFTCIGANDAIICIISHIFFFSSCLCTAFAQHNWQLYLRLLPCAFSGYQGSLTTSMISKWLEPHERNSIFTLLTLTNTIIFTCGSTLFNWIYARVVISLPNLTFFIAAILSLVALVLNIILVFVSRKIINEESPVSTSNDANPMPIHFQQDAIVHVDDTNCLIIRSRSSSITLLNTPFLIRSRVNSISYNETQNLPNNTACDQNIL
ncbi:unnamed protein product [Adineta ricciae]|uniref:Uncharacterized protein n=1 Tax=Adineta ricciae TaxID=249248 RepID=A0A814X3B1_ADIRI|nr:unnamed protein product [Adineta ricciae]CAF1213820.1 unnamed protein product [Adineta ricciae]